MIILNPYSQCLLISRETKLRIYGKNIEARGREKNVLLL